MKGLIAMAAEAPTAQEDPDPSPMENSKAHKGVIVVDETAGKDELNSYMALRAAKIARNEARLAELGLLRPLPPATTPSRKSRRKPRTIAPVEISGLRRSTRHTSRPTAYSDPPEPQRKRTKTKVSPTHWSTHVEVDESPPPPVLTSISSKSVRSIRLDVGALCDEVLGMFMNQTGKAHVVEESVRRTSSRTDAHGLSFNKYCGVQEWNNDALFLWVNLGGNNGEYVNDFMDGGRQMTWFGGSRMHDESNVILRLLRVGQRAKDGQLPSTDGIILWCRQYCPEKRSFGPYVCLGRLAYHRHAPGSRPLQFVWSLLDYDRLVNHEQAEVRKMFQSIAA